MGDMRNWSDEKRRRVAAELAAEMRLWSLDGLLERQATAFATCRKCRRVVPIDLARLAEACGRSRDLAVVELRLRCAACRHKGALIGIVWREPGQPLLRVVA